MMSCAHDALTARCGREGCAGKGRGGEAESPRAGIRKDKALAPHGHSVEYQCQTRARAVSFPTDVFTATCIPREKLPCPRSGHKNHLGSWYSDWIAIWLSSAALGPSWPAIVSG